jgi:hypothetical protein
MARKAVLVGINNYKNVNDLRGCLNDVINMRDILKSQLGFTNADISVLTDSRATKENIVRRLNWLVNNARAGDYLVFQFSGHGSQIRDRDGDERLADGLDELICPWDMDWNKQTYISDDALNTIFRRLPAGVQLEVFLDSCHSGTGLRAVETTPPSDVGARNRLAETVLQTTQMNRSIELVQSRPILNRYLPPPVDLLCRFEGEEDTLQRKRLFQSGIRDTVHQILWAACRDYQVSADAYIDGAFNGAFTYYFCKTMRETGNQLCRSEVLNRVRAALQFNHYNQIPQIECEATARATCALDAAEGRPIEEALRRKPTVTDKERRTVALKTNKTRATTLVH